MSAAPHVSAVRAVTVGVRDLARARTFFTDVIGLRVEHETPVGAALAGAWADPSLAGRPLVELSNLGYPHGRLRLLGCAADAPVIRLEPPAGGGDPATAVGPKAIDFYVRDPIADAVARVEKAGYAFWSKPCRHEIGATVSEEAVFSGPDGVPILLMVGHAHSPLSLRAGSPEREFSEAATLSVITGDPAAARRFYGEGLGLALRSSAESPPEYRDLVAELTGTPPGTRVSWLMYGEGTEPSGKILLLHFHDRTGPRLRNRMRPGALGYSLLTHEVRGLDEALARLHATGVAEAGPAVPVERFGRRERVALVRGPDGESLELVEAA